MEEYELKERKGRIKSEGRRRGEGEEEPADT